MSETSRQRFRTTRHDISFALLPKPRGVGPSHTSTCTGYNGNLGGEPASLLLINNSLWIDVFFAVSLDYATFKGIRYYKKTLG